MSAQMASCSMAVPTSFQLMTVEVVGRVQLAGRRGSRPRAPGRTRCRSWPGRRRCPRLSRACMSKSCCTSVTSDAGSRPASVMPANSSNSLPKPQLPTFLPFRSAGSVMSSALLDTCSVPERWKIWAMSVMPAPCSRDWSALGTQAMAKSALPWARTVWGVMSTPPSRISTSRPCVPVEALVDGGVVAGELGLRDPLQLQLDRLELAGGDRRSRPASAGAVGRRRRRCRGAAAAVVRRRCRRRCRSATAMQRRSGDRPC